MEITVDDEEEEETAVIVFETDQNGHWRPQTCL